MCMYKNSEHAPIEHRQQRKDTVTQGKFKLGELN